MKRIRTMWQRTPKPMRDIQQRQVLEISDLRAEAQQLRADGRNLLVQRDEARRVLELLANVKRVDVVITPPGEGLTTYYAVHGRNQITPVFGVLPGDKILVARKRIL